MLRPIILLSLSALLAGPATAGAAAPDKPLADKAAKPATTPNRPVDINRATRAELKTLPGIGDAEADRIIAARPYPSKAKLVADKVLSMDAYLALKGRIVATQPDPVASSTKR